MRRREVISLVGGMAAWPGRAWGQSLPRRKTIGILESGGSYSTQYAFEALKRALATEGWTESKNLNLIYKATSGERSKAVQFANDILARHPDAVLATNTEMVQALHSQNQTVPIIFVQVPDPIGSGFVRSLARPSSHITGFINFDASIASKWLALLGEMSGTFRRVGVLLQKNNPTAAGFLTSVESAAVISGVVPEAAFVDGGDEIVRAFDDFSAHHVDGVIVPPSAMASISLDVITASSLARKIPTLSTYREFVIAGGLICYGYDRIALYEQAADYLSRVLKGTNVSDLPVQAPKKFDLIINSTTAKKIGVHLSDKMFALADEVIE